MILCHSHKTSFLQHYLLILKILLCHHNKNLEIHHIIPRYLNNFLRDDELNLITLCKECHKMVQKMFDITLKVWRIEFNKLIKQSIESI